MMHFRYKFIKKSFTFRKLVNAFKLYLSYIISIATKKPFVWGFPPIVMIEITNICNLKCPLCPSGNGSMKREKGQMSLDLFKIIIDQIKDKTFGVILWNQGEPFINNDFLKMVKYASDSNLHTLVSTNANINFNSKEIIDSGLDSMIISMDGATQNTYNKYRINGEIDKVYTNIKNLVKTKSTTNSSLPEINLQFLVMRHNESELKQMEAISKELDVDSLVFKSLQIYSKEDVDLFLPKNPKYRRYKIKNGEFELKFGLKNRCYRIWAQPVVNWDGRVSVCCFDKDIDYPMGNINKDRLVKIWKNKSFMNMRSNILKNRNKIPMCRNCGEGVKLKIKQRNVN